jgi:hypothetical protein
MSTELVHHGGSGTSFSLEGGGFRATLQALGYFVEVTSVARERAEARATDAIRTAQEMSGHYHALTNVIEQMVEQEVDQASIAEAIMIRDQIEATMQHCRTSANYDYLAHQTAAEASAMSAQSQQNVFDRHGGMAAAAEEASVEMAAKEFYLPQ